MNSRFEFSATDFDNLVDSWSALQVARRANKILDQHFDPEKCEHEPKTLEWTLHLSQGLELGPKTYSEHKTRVFAAECSKCGIELKATWSEV